MAKEKKIKDPNAPNLRENLLWNSRAVSQAMNILILGYLNIYCSSILGINVAVVGTIMMASKIFDGFTDIVVGYIVDRTHTRLGKGRPYEICIVFYWLCTVLMFSCPPGWEMTAKCVWIFAMYTMINSIFGTFLSSAIVPYSVRAFNNERKYVVYGSVGGLLSVAGSMVVNIAFPQMMNTLGSSAAGWQKMILVFAVPCATIGLLRFIFIPEKFDVDAGADKVNLKEVWECLKHNKYIYPVAIMTMIYQFVANMGVTTYYYTYVVNNIGAMSLIGVTAIVMIPFLALSPAILKKITVRQMCMIGFTLCIFGFGLIWFAKDNIAMLVGLGIISGAGVLPINMFSTLMIYDCADYNEWQGRPRMEGTLGVIPGLGQKLGSAFGGFALGVLLNASGFISTAEGEAVTQPDSAILMIRLLASVIPAVLYAAALGTCFLYKLDKIKPQMRKDIDERRAVRDAGAAEVAE